MKFHKKHHHTRRSSSSNQHKFSLYTLERFFLNYGLGITGIVLLFLGLILLVINHFGRDTVLSLIQSLMKPGPDEAFNPVNQHFPLTLILSLSILYLPGFVPLIVYSFISNEKLLLRNILIVSGFLWLIFVEGKVFLYNAYSYGIFFTSFYSAFIYFLIIQILLIVVSVINKSRLALNLSVVFFFISIALIRSYFGGLVPFFLLLIFFQFTIFFISLKFRWRSPFVSMVLLSACYLIFYILRKIIFAGSNQPVSYMLPALLIWFVISVTGLAILKPGSIRKNVSLLWDIISYVSPLLVVGSGAYMIHLFGQSSLYPLCSAFVIVSLVLLSILNERYDFLISKRAFYFAVCFVSASLVPQLLFSNFFLVFSACLAVTMAIHAHLTHSKFSFGLSKVFLLITVALYLLEWAFNIVPALTDQKTSGEIYPLHLVLVILLIASISFFYIKLSSYIIIEHRFKYRQTKILINNEEIILPLIIFSSCFLLADYVLITIFPGYRLNVIELATFTYTFLLLSFFRNPSYKRPVLIFRTIISFIAIALYPAIIHAEAIQYRNLFLEGNTSAIVPFIMHFLCLGLLILLLFQTRGYLINILKKLGEIQHLFILMIVILVTFILLTEYDSLSLLLFNRAGNIPVTEILRTNKIVPYSIILLTVSISFLIFSLIRYSRFLRRVSLIMILLVIIKILFLDLKILTGNTIVILLVSVGLILLGVALIIRRIRNKRNNRLRGTSSEVITLQ